MHREKTNRKKDREEDSGGVGEKHEAGVEWEKMRGTEWKEESGGDRGGRVIWKQWSKSK